MATTKLMGIRVQHDDPVACAVIADMLKDELVIVFAAWVASIPDPKPVIELFRIGDDTSPTTLRPF
jgi:hypothetical protein